MADREITFEARQKLISEYTGSCVPELGIIGDNVRKSIEEVLPDNCIIATRMSEDNTILSIDVVSVE